MIDWRRMQADSTAPVTDALDRRASRASGAGAIESGRPCRTAVHHHAISCDDVFVLFRRWSRIFRYFLLCFSVTPRVVFVVETSELAISPWGGFLFLKWCILVYFQWQSRLQWRGHVPSSPCQTTLMSPFFFYLIILALEVRQSHSLPTFRNRLKTFCFRSAYPYSYLSPCALILLETSALYKLFTYLLTYLLTIIAILTFIMLCYVIMLIFYPYNFCGLCFLFSFFLWTPTFCIRR